MNNYHKIIFLFFIISFISCNKSIETSDANIPIESININPLKSKKITVSSIFDSITYIPIGNKKDEPLLKEITKLEIFKFHIYILDKQLNNLYIYDINGNFIKKIGNIGQGPGEFIKISDFAINAISNEVIILDRTGRKILIYNLNGDFKYTNKINIMAQQLAVSNNQYISYTSGSDYFTKSKNSLGYNLFILNKDCSIQSKLFKYNKDLDNIINSKALDVNIDDNIVSFNYAIYDTIYLIKGGEIIKKINIDFNKSKLPINKINSENFKYYTNKTGYSRLSKVFYSHDYLFINYIYNNKIHFAIHRKNDKSLINSSFLENDIDSTSFSLAMPLKISKNKLYFTKTAQEILSNYNKESITINKRTITEESNPIIIIGHLK
jgi:hypothetical protein